jgi:flagellar hook-associated protein 2
MSTTTFDPTSTAASLAKAYTDPAQQLLTQQTADATQTDAALTKLQNALSAFDSALATLSGKKSVVSQSAAFSDSSVGTATASVTAQPGTYSFFVQQLATTDQKVYANLASAPVSAGGTLAVNLAGGGGFSVDLSSADLDGNGTLTPTEVATAINTASGNTSLVTASLVTVSGQSQMVLSSNASGAANAVSLDTSGLAAGGIKDALDAGSTLVTGQDAIVWLGAEGTGIKLQQASNTFDAVAGVSMTFNKAMVSGTAPVNVTVATDPSGTASNVQSFVDAYNSLESVLDSLTNTGDAANGVSAAVFANDSAVRTLRSRLESTIRQSVGGVSLASYGVTAERDGSLSLDQAKLGTKLAADPTGLDTLLGKTGLTTSSGVLGALDSYLNLWTNGTSGQIKHRQDGINALQDTLTKRQTTIDDQYNSVYARYLAQFTQLANLQAQMANTTNLFDALFNSDSKN